MCCFNLINSRLQYEGALKYLGESVTGSGIGIWNLWDGSCVAVRYGRVGMLTDVQVCQHDSTAYAQGFCHLKREADDHDIIRWHHCCYAYIEGWELYKESMHEPWVLIWVIGCITSSYILWGATDPLLWLPWCLSRSEITTLHGNVLYLFNCKCPQLSRHPKLVCFYYLQVTRQLTTLDPLRPYITVARTAISQCWLVHVG